MRPAVSICRCFNYLHSSYLTLCFAVGDEVVLKFGYELVLIMCVEDSRSINTIINYIMHYMRLRWIFNINIFHLIF